MKVLIARIPEEGSHLEGEDPATILEMENESFSKVTGDVRYALYAQHVSEELIVRGTLSVDVDLKCTR
jgi:hypothetical protein